MANPIDRNSNTHERHRHNWQRLADMLLNGIVAVDNATIEYNALTLRVKDLGISTAKLADNAVTVAKFQQITTQRLLGRQTAGTGNVEQLTVGGGVEFVAGGIQTSALTGDVTKAAGGTATTIVANAVTFAQMQDINTARLIGRLSASTGDPQEVSFNGQGLANVSGVLGVSVADTFGTILSGGNVAVRGHLQEAGDPATEGWTNYNTLLKGHRADSSGIIHSFGGSCSINTADSSAIANTAAETNFSLTYTVPANGLAVGRVLRVTFGGKYSTTGTPTLAIRFKIGTTIFLTPSFATTPAGSSNRAFGGECLIVCTAVGGTGKVRGTGWGNLDTGTDALVSRAGDTTVDTTTSQQLAISAQWGTADPANTITLEIFSVELVA